MSQRIRDLKFARRFHQRSLQYWMLAKNYAPQTPDEARYLKLHAALAHKDYGWSVGSLMGQLRALRNNACAMMEIRKEAKVEAQRQYLAARAVVSTC
jgi:3-oxoacyl-(acyl-carrier-protein) synthase